MVIKPKPPSASHLHHLHGDLIHCRMMLSWCAHVTWSVCRPSDDTEQTCAELCDGIKWSLIHATRQRSTPSLWPCSPSQFGIALQWLSNTFSHHTHTKDTNIVFVTHILCIFSLAWTHTHSQYQLQRVLCVFTDWLGSYWGEREREAGGRRETARDRGITKKRRQRQQGEEETRSDEGDTFSKL